MQFKLPSIIAATLLGFSTFGDCCLQYRATQNKYGDYLQATLTDNGQEVCWFGPSAAGSDGLYRFTCFQGNFAAIAGDTGITVQYANPWGNFAFQAQINYGNNAGTYSIYADEYGC